MHRKKPKKELGSCNEHIHCLAYLRYGSVQSAIYNQRKPNREGWVLFFWSAHVALSIGLLCYGGDKEEVHGQLATMLLTFCGALVNLFWMMTAKVVNNNADPTQEHA